MPLAGLTPPSQPLASHVLPGSQSSSLSQLLAALLEHVALMPQFLLWSRTRSPPWARMSSALVMASGPSCAVHGAPRAPRVRAVMEPVVVISPSSHAMAGHMAVGDGVGTGVGTSVGFTVGAPVVGMAVGAKLSKVGLAEGALVGGNVGAPVGTGTGTPVGSLVGSD